MLNYRNRYYNPTWGRFVSEDPIGLAGGVNVYAYANGDPTDLRDPTGLYAVAGDPTAGSPPTGPSAPNPFPQGSDPSVKNPYMKADIGDDLSALGGGTPKILTTPKGATMFLFPNGTKLRFDLQPGQYLGNQGPHINLESPGGGNIHIPVMP